MQENPPLIVPAIFASQPITTPDFWKKGGFLGLPIQILQ
jgi:hypothetical protein